MQAGTSRQRAFVGMPADEILAALEPNSASRATVEPALRGLARATVYLRGASPAAIRTGLAKLFDFRWVRDSGGRAILSAGAASRARDRLLREQDARRIQREIGQLVEYTRRPPEDYHRLLAQGERELVQDILLRSLFPFLADPSAHSAIAFLGTIPWQAYEATVSRLGRTGPIRVPWRDMTPRQQSLATALAVGSDLPLARFGVTVAYSVTRELFVSGVDVGASSRPKGLISFLNQHRPPPAGGGSLRVNPYETARSLADRRQLPHATERAVPKGPEGRDVRDLARLLWSESSWDGVIGRLAGLLPGSVFSDFYAWPPSQLDFENPRTPRELEATVPALLDSICAQYDRVWWYSDGAYFFRSRFWYWDDLHVVPTQTLATLERMLADRDAATPELIDLLVRLTERQFSGLGGLAEHALNRRLPALLNPEGLSRLMPMWRSLSREQKRSLLGSGLLLSQMRPEQLDLLQEGLIRIRAAPSQVLEPGALAITSSVESVDGTGAPAAGRRRCLVLRATVGVPVGTPTRASLRLLLPTHPSGPGASPDRDLDP
jgi:hypothetical protein